VVVGSDARKRLKQGLIWATRGQLLNVAAAIHGQPTTFPGRGPGRFLQVRPDDTFLVSYPRSGNTWLRFLIANLTHREIKVDYANIENLIPDIYVTSELRLRSMLGPRILKSHEAFDPRYRKVVYVVRDPRRVIISQFNTMRRLRSDLIGNCSLEEFVERHLRGEFDAWFGTWSANVNSWIHQAKEDVSLLVVKYEELRKDSLEVATRTVAFLGIKVAAEDLRRAVANSSREKMVELYGRSGARLEAAIGAGNAGYLRPTPDTTDPGMTPRIEERIRARFGPLMASLGYL
jgi:hypothetical protein